MSARRPVVFTEAEISAIRMAAHGVWNEIAADVMTVVKEQEGADTILRDHVLELVCDAGRLEDRIRRANRALATRVADMPYKQLLDLLRPAFPYSRYE